MKDHDHEMFWETHAREAVESALQNAEFDELRGVIRLSVPNDPYDYHHQFNDAEAVYQFLVEAGESEWMTYVPFDSGEAVFDPNVEDYVADAMRKNKVEEFFSAMGSPAESEELYLARTAILPAGSAPLRLDMVDISDELIRYFAKHPDKMHELHPRKFEELIADLFKAKGYEVELTPPSKDGGFDIRAVRRSDVGRALTLIECKKYRPAHPVGVEIVRGLYGVVESNRATSGLIVTTSRFTKGAVGFRDQHMHRMELADYDKIVEYLKNWK